MWLRGAGAARRVPAASGWPRAPSRPRPRPPPSGPAEPPSPPPRDYAVPNGGWSEAMRGHYRRLSAMADDGTWRRLPSYRSARHHLPEAAPGDTRLFLRAIDGEGAGFEYAMFLSASRRRLLCLFQPGPYLEGHPGLTHGGAIAAILDSALGTCALAVAGKVVTANLSIDYLAPVPLGTVLLVEAQAERQEGRKVFLSGQVRGADGDTVHAKATGLFIQLDSTKYQAQWDGGAR